MARSDADIMMAGSSQYNRDHGSKTVKVAVIHGTSEVYGPVFNGPVTHIAIGGNTMMAVDINAEWLPIRNHRPFVPVGSSCRDCQ